MDILSRKLKPVALAGVFLIVACGRWLNLYIVRHEPFGFSLKLAAVYGTAFGFVFYHLVDLFLARGFLQAKITWARTTALYSLALVILNRLILSAELRYSRPVVAVEAVFTLAFGVTSIVADLRLTGRKEYLRAPDSSLPRRYLGRRAMRTVSEAMFRLLPRPEPIGLYRIGAPDETSMVLLTGNYELTIRRVANSLRNTNCWLLVCDSRGINIWCASLANHFNTNGVVRAIRQSRLDSRVAHRKIILPQLCAANISLGEIAEQTGFLCEFGPVRIDDLGEYLKHPKNTDIRRVTFPLSSRVEMAAGTLFLPVIFAALVFNFINPDMLIFILPAFYALSVFNAIVFPCRFISNVRIWSLVFATSAFLFVWATCVFVLKVPGIAYAVATGVAAMYFVNEFEGWSPLVKFSLTGAYTSAKIEVSSEKCIGCGTCVAVCPKGVYSIVDGKSLVKHTEECCSCKSCFVQCPEEAITHSAEKIDETLA